MRGIHWPGERDENVGKAEERAQLHKAIWKIANDLRGSVDGWDFKAYVLGFLFYRFISENLTDYLNAEERAAADGDPDFDYARLDDADAEVARENLNERLSRVFRYIEGSAKGTGSESDLRGLFDDIDVNSAKLGNTVAERNAKLVKIMDAIGDLDLSYGDSSIDAFGDAYEYLMTMYASSAGKSGGARSDTNWRLVFAGCLSDSYRKSLVQSWLQGRSLHSFTESRSFLSCDLRLHPSQ